MNGCDLDQFIKDAERLHAELDNFAEGFARDISKDIPEVIALTRAATRALTARDCLFQALCGLRSARGRAYDVQATIDVRRLPGDAS